MKHCKYLILILIFICGYFYRVTSEASANDLSEAYVFPVPYVPESGHDKISFVNISKEATIKIYSLSGDLVKTLEESDGDHVSVWSPVENESGIMVASGIYIYYIYNEVSIKIGKLIISR